MGWESEDAGGRVLGARGAASAGPRADRLAARLRAGTAPIEDGRDWRAVLRPPVARRTVHSTHGLTQGRQPPISREVITAHSGRSVRSSRRPPTGYLTCRPTASTDPAAACRLRACTTSRLPTCPASCSRIARRASLACQFRSCRFQVTPSCATTFIRSPHLRGPTGLRASLVQPRRLDPLAAHGAAHDRDLRARTLVRSRGVAG